MVVKRIEEEHDDDYDNDTYPCHVLLYYNKSYIKGLRLPTCTSSTMSGYGGRSSDRWREEVGWKARPLSIVRTSKDSISVTLANITFTNNNCTHNIMSQNGIIKVYAIIYINVYVRAHEMAFDAGPFLTLRISTPARHVWPQPHPRPKTFKNDRKKTAESLTIKKRSHPVEIEWHFSILLVYSFNFFFFLDWIWK